MVDIHCHILPGVDDGSKSWETTLAMCDAAVRDGIDHLVATPHANDRYAYDREHFASLLDDLRKHLTGPVPTLSLGCDFHMSYDNLQDLFIDPKRFVIEGSNYLLIEFSNYSIPPQMTDWLVRLIDQGITPVITHPERYPGLRPALGRVLQWVELGCAV
jgi:protein-tyrosine phosphatase